MTGTTSATAIAGVPPPLLEGGSVVLPPRPLGGAAAASSASSGHRGRRIRSRKKCAKDVLGFCGRRPQESRSRATERRSSSLPRILFKGYLYSLKQPQQDHKASARPAKQTTQQATMADEEDIAALVIDNGSGMCKGKLMCRRRGVLLTDDAKVKATYFLSGDTGPAGTSWGIA